MVFTWLLILFAAIFLTALALHAGLFWLAGKLFRVPQITYRRSLLVIAAIVVVNLALAGLRIALGYPLFTTSGVDLVGVAIPFLAIGLLLRTSWGKTLGLGLVWMVLAAVLGVGIALGIRQALAEPFVIPTGGNAETLWGHQKIVTCPQCQFTFPVDAAAEVEGNPPRRVVGCTCPNCRYDIDFARQGMAPETRGGDRIFATKGLLRGTPARFDMVVFRYPKQADPQTGPIIYPKRLVGLPGESIGIYGGKLYLRRDPGEDGQERGASVAPDEAAALFAGKDAPFTILRKPPEQILALRRLVYDNSYSAKDAALPRWAPEGEKGQTWTADWPKGFRHVDAGEDMNWLRYRHLLCRGPEPELITDFLGYNGKAFAGWGGRPDFTPQSRNWVGDLILECLVMVDRSGGEFVLELAKGVDRFRAAWQLDSGTCTLTRLHDGQEEVLASKPTTLNKPGTYQVRFANVDERLTVWVDQNLPFGEGVAYPAPPKRGPRENDLQPAGVGCRAAAVRIPQLKLWRDTYYTVGVYPPADAEVVQRCLREGSPEEAEQELHRLWSDSGRWEGLRQLPGMTFAVKPGHYFVLGDNSPESSDSRSWGLVPERLLLGKAVGVYYPFARAGPIH